MQPGAVANNGATGEQLIKQADKSWTLQRQGGKPAQPVPIRSKLVRLLLMKQRQLCQHRLL
ncbi:hypothetical protein D3C84_1199850 [compost metagenome]